jgi:hypothetical protein
MVNPQVVLLSAASHFSRQVLDPDVHTWLSALIPVQRQSINSSRPEFLPMLMCPVRGAPDRDRGPRTRAVGLHFLREKLHFLRSKLDVS